MTAEEAYKGLLSLALQMQGCMSADWIESESAKRADEVLCYCMELVKREIDAEAKANA